MAYDMAPAYLEGGLALGSVGHVKRDIGTADIYVKEEIDHDGEINIYQNKNHVLSFQLAWPFVVWIPLE